VIANTAYAITYVIVLVRDYISNVGGGGGGISEGRVSNKVLLST